MSASDVPDESSRDFSERIIKELLFDLDQRYQEAVADVGERHGLQPPSAPKSGPDLYFRSYAIGIAAYHSLQRLSDANLSAAVREYLTMHGILETSDLPSEALLRFGTLKANDGFVSAVFRLELIGDALGTITSSMSRAGDLLELIKIRALSERALSYLLRATRLYLHGLDLESMIMSAVVIEVAYENRFDDEELAVHRVARAKKSKVEQYEVVARESGVYSRADFDMARNLRVARNHAIHNIPDPQMSAKDALQTCAHLLNKLYPAPV